MFVWRYHGRLVPGTSLHIKSSKPSGKKPAATGDKRFVFVVPHPGVAWAGAGVNAPTTSAGAMSSNRVRIFLKRVRVFMVLSFFPRSVDFGIGGSGKDEEPSGENYPPPDSDPFSCGGRSRVAPHKCHVGLWSDAWLGLHGL